MSKWINADLFEARMYHEAFETDTDMQKWDSGCWIRYKMFENFIADAPSLDIVMCKECVRANHELSGIYCGLSDVNMGENGFCSIGKGVSDE